MDFVKTEGRTFFVCHLKIRTYSLYMTSHAVCQSEATTALVCWALASIALLWTPLEKASLPPGDPPKGGLQSLGHTHPSTWLGFSDHSSHGVKESRFASSLRQVVRHLAQWILFLLGLLNWEDDSPKLLLASHLTDHMLSGEWRTKKPAEPKESSWDHLSSRLQPCLMLDAPLETIVI